MISENVTNIDSSISDIANNDSIINYDIDGTNNHKCHSFSSTKSNKDMDITSSDGNISININIYRYKFTNEFIEELYKFSKIHQYDERKDFKEAWKKWVDENIEAVNIEIKRMTDNGYNGDILDKMFKSARYYFRKKNTDKKEPKQRRDYIGSQKDFLKEIDEFILKNVEYKPADSFLEFCKQK